MKWNKNSIFYHCLLLSSSSVILELLGFVYRILLGRFAGAQAIAIHGLVMSAYNVVLSCTLTGVALSVSRIASSYSALGQGRSVIRLIRTALFLFLSLFCLLAVPFARNRTFFAERVLGNAQTRSALLFLIPCLFLTGFENVHKAFFYGTGQTMIPTVSETLEMLCRIGAAIFLFQMTANRQLSDGAAAAMIVCGMIFSEIVSASFLVCIYHRRKGKMKGKDEVTQLQILKDIASVAVPVSLSTLIGRLISSANMVLIPQILMRSGNNRSAAMEQFGIISGMTMPMLMLPSAFLSPLITVLSPRFSAGKSLENDTMIRRKAAKALHIVGLIGIPSMTLMLIFGKRLGELLYRNPSVGNHLPILTLITLLGFYYAVSESILESIGMQKRCSVLTVAASMLGLICTLLLGGAMKWGMEGFLLGELLSSLLGAGCCVLWLKKETGLCIRWKNWLLRPLFASVLSGLWVRLISYVLDSVLCSPVLSLGLCVAVFLAGYLCFLRLLGTNFWKYTKNTLVYRL